MFGDFCWHLFKMNMSWADDERIEICQLKVWLRYNVQGNFGDWIYWFIFGPLGFLWDQEQKMIPSGYLLQFAMETHRFEYVDGTL